MNKVEEYVTRYKDKDNYLRPCLAEGLIYGKSLYTSSLCSNCKFNIDGDYNFGCDMTMSTLI